MPGSRCRTCDSAKTGDVYPCFQFPPENYREFLEADSYYQRVARLTAA